MISDAHLDKYEIAKARFETLRFWKRAKACGCQLRVTFGLAVNRPQSANPVKISNPPNATSLLSLVNTTHFG
jgi:hypothetical protein